MKHELNTDGKKMEWWSIGVMGRLADVGKGGQKAGKWRSFSHLETGLTRLFPRFSTQVVDFPLLSRLRVEGVYELRVRSWELRKKVAEGGWSVRKSADCYGLFGFPSPPRDGCPDGVIRSRETWSRININL